MNKLYTLSLALFAYVAAFAQSKNPSDYKVKGNGFYENKGQIVDQNYQPNHAVKYLLCQPGLNVQLRQTGFSYDTYTEDVTPSSSNLPSRGDLEGQGKFQTPPDITRHYHRVDIELVGCNTAAPMLAENKSESYFNYFTAGTPQGGVSEVHYYQKVTYKNIYPNIDLTFFTSPSSSGEGKGGVEYNFIVHPGGNPADIKLQYKGANKVTLASLPGGQTGNKLIVNVQAGDFTENIPSSYLQNTKQPVQVNYASAGNNTYSFSVSKFPPLERNSEALIIDPTPNLLWGTYYGGTVYEYNTTNCIAIDASSNTYITGETGSATNIATAGAYKNAFSGGSDAFIAKFNPTGSSLIWGTYYGGTNNDCGQAIAIDASDNVYITGITYSNSGIATAGAYQTVYSGTYKAFIAKFNPTGSSLLWGTYYGGPGGDEGYAIALDPSDNVYITGSTTSSSGIATVGAYQTVFSGTQIIMIAKFNSTGSSLLYGTYFGGGNSYGYAIALDASSNVYITGYAGLNGMTTAGAYQATIAGSSDVYVAKFNATLSSLLWGTYYGGTNTDVAYGIALDASDNVYITGWTFSNSGIATAGAYQTTYGGSFDVFVAKFNSTGSSLIWGTYYGGATNDVAEDLALDAGDNVYITGYTNSTSGIATVGAYQTTLGGGDDGFVAKFNSTGSSLIWGTYYGGAGTTDEGEGIVLDASGSVYITGFTNSASGIASVGAYKTVYTATGSNPNAFVSKFSNPQSLSSTGSQTDVNCFGNCNGTATAIPSGGTSPYTYSWSGGQTNAIATGLCAGSYTCTVTDATAATTTVSVTITEPTQLRDSITTTTNILCNGGNNGSATVGVKGGTTGYTYSWAPSGGSNVTATGLTAGSYSIIVTDANGCIVTALVTITQPPLLTLGLSQTNPKCNGACTGTITPSASGGTLPYTYSGSVSSLCAATYTITVTDANGCTATASATITQPALLTVSTTVNGNVLCNGGNTGKITANPSGGTGAYTYNWSPSGGTNATASNLTAGTYTVTVTDNNGCTATATSTITQPTALSGIPNANPNSICKGDCSTISVTESGGTPAYTYSWNTGATTSSLTVCPTALTVYSVTTTDGNGCSTVTVVTVNINPLPTVSMSAAKDTACVNWTTDALTGNPSGGTFTGAGVTGSNFNPNTAGLGTHKVLYTYTDVNGCTNKDSVNVVVSSCTGVNEVNVLDEQIKFYPNPFSQSISVNISYNGSVTITMFNMLGENVGTWTMDKGLNTINTSTMPSGVYMLQVKTSNGVLNKKLVKVN